MQTKIVAVLAVAVLMLAGLAGLFLLSDDSEAKGDFVITDMRDREVEIPAEIDGIVALGACSLRLLSYFDSIDKVIGVEDSGGHEREKTQHAFFHLATYRIAHPDLRDLPSIGDRQNTEAIIAANPSIVIASMTDVSVLDQLQSALAIPVVAIDADVEMNNMERFNLQLTMMGKVLGEETRAQELIDGIDSIFQDLDARASLVTEPKTAYAGGMMYFGPANLYRTTGDYLPFDLTGVTNVMPTNPANNKQPYLSDIETLIAEDPQYIFIDAANEGLSKSGYEANKATLNAEVTAFAEEDVYITLVYKYYGTNWENQLINTYFVGMTVYPDLYDDITLKDKAEEIWKLFFQVDLKYNNVVDIHSGVGSAQWFD